MYYNYCEQNYLQNREFRKTRANKIDETASVVSLNEAMAIFGRSVVDDLMAGICHHELVDAFLISDKGLGALVWDNDNGEEYIQNITSKKTFKQFD